MRVESTDDPEARPALPRRIAEGTWWFSTCVEVQVSGTSRHNHNSCFLLLGDDATMLVDTGMPYGWVQLREELLAALGGRPIDYLFPTHPEAPHMGNLGPLMEEFPGSVVIGDLRNYQLYFPGYEARMLEKRAGDVVDLGGRRVHVLEAVVHDLPNTLWAFDDGQSILFTSDAYCYTHEHDPSECGCTSEEVAVAPVASDTMTVIERALHWTKFVDPRLVCADLDALARRIQPRLVAPAHGGVITDPVRLTEVFKGGLGLVGARAGA